MGNKKRKLETEAYMTQMHTKISHAKSFLDTINSCFPEVEVICSSFILVIVIVWDEAWNSVNPQMSLWRGVYLYDLMMKKPCLSVWMLRDWGWVAAVQKLTHKMLSFSSFAPFAPWGCWREAPGPTLSSWNNPSTTLWGIFLTQEQNLLGCHFLPHKENFLHIWFQLLTILFLMEELFCSFWAVSSQSKMSKGIYFVHAAGSHTFWLQHGETSESSWLLPNRNLKDVIWFSISHTFDGTFTFYIFWI